jgi:hypothetical protein
LEGGAFRSNISLFGVDENKDGFTERSLNESVEYVSTPTPNTIRLSIDGNVSVPSDSYLVLRYDGISNPDYADTYTVETTITGNKTSTDSGHIRYSENLTGLVGHGTNLSINRGRSQLVTLRSSETAVTNDSMYLFLPTQPDPTRQRTYSLSVTEEHRSDTSESTNSRGVMEKMTLFGRFAYVFSNPKVENKTIAVRGYTNIAPGSRLSVQVYNTGRLREAGTTVANSQSLSINMTLPNELLRSNLLRIRVLDHDGDKLGEGVLIRDQSLPRKYPGMP